MPQPLPFTIDRHGDIVDAVDLSELRQASRLQPKPAPRPVAPAPAVQQLGLFERPRSRR